MSVELLHVLPIQSPERTQPGQWFLRTATETGTFQGGHGTSVVSAADIWEAILLRHAC